MGEGIISLIFTVAVGEALGSRAAGADCAGVRGGG